VVAATSALSCTDDEGSSPPPPAVDAIDQIKDATFAAGSARYAGEAHFADGATGAIEGVSQAEPPAGEVTRPVPTENGVQQVRTVWVDGQVYLERAVTTDPGAVSATLRLADERPWIQATYTPMLTASFDAYDPFRLVQRLAQLDVDAAPQGTETVDGDELDRYVVDMSSTPVAPAGAQTIELLTDDQARLTVVRLLGELQIEYALDDFGTEVTPSPPAEDQIGEPRQQPGPEPVGAYEVVGQGTSADVAWQLLRAPASDGGACWRLDTTPPLDAVAASESDGATCIEPFDPTAPAEAQVQIVADAGRGAPFDALAVVTPARSTGAELVFVDRSSEDLVVDPAGFVVWVGPKSPLAVVFEVTIPDGTMVSCGVGIISVPAEIGDLRPDELEDLDRTPWTCIAV
jgi:hypothetical protein